MIVKTKTKKRNNRFINFWMKKGQGFERLKFALTNPRGK